MMNIKTQAMLFNIAWFQVCWFACVMIGNKAAMFVLALVFTAYLLIEKLRAEWPLLVGIVLLGLIVDSSLIATGVLKANSTVSLPPLWLSVLWLAFATTLNHSLKPLLDKQLLFLLLTVIGGPVCYNLGVRLSDIEFGQPPVIALSIIAAAWLLAGLIILKLYERWKDHVYV